MLTDPKKILLVSNEPWGDLWFSKHHYANELSCLGYEVYFLNPPGKWNPGHLFDWRVISRKYSNGLTIVSTKNPLPIRIFPKISTLINDSIVLNRLNRVLHLKGDFILWQFDFLRFVYNSIQSSKKRLYHVADPYMSDWRDGIVASKADLIICTSPKYVNYYKKNHPEKNIIHVPHGISKDEAKVDPEVVDSIVSEYGDYILLIGTINEDVDLALLSKLINSYKVVAIGKVALKLSESKNKWGELSVHYNFSYLGVLHAKDLKNYVRGAKICVLTYKFSLSKFIGSGSPLKILNYIAQNKPVVSSIDPEIPSLLESGIYWADKEEEYMNLIDQGMNGKLSVDENKVQSYLDQNVYSKLIQEILSVLV